MHVDKNAGLSHRNRNIYHIYIYICWLPTPSPLTTNLCCPLLTTIKPLLTTPTHYKPLLTTHLTTDCNSLRRGTSKLLELVPNPFDLFNKLCSKQTTHHSLQTSADNPHLTHWPPPPFLIDYRNFYCTSPHNHWLQTSAVFNIHPWLTHWLHHMYLFIGLPVYVSTYWK